MAVLYERVKHSLTFLWIAHFHAVSMLAPALPRARELRQGKQHRST